MIKRMLDNMVIQEGDFTDDYFHKNDWWRDLPEMTGMAPNNNMDFEKALLEAEGDENDARAAITARNEMDMDEQEFQEQQNSSHRRRQSICTATTTSPAPSPGPTATATPSERMDTQSLNYDEEEEEEEVQLSVGHIDQYMLRFWEREMFGKYLGFGGLPEEEEDGFRMEID